MQRLKLPLKRGFICAFLLICLVKISSSQAQTLKLNDFAIWGGSAPTSPYNNTQGVFINNNAIIEGNIGSNHLLDIKNNLTLKGNIYSGNRVLYSDYAKITGNIFANKLGTNLSPTISGGNKDTITGNLTANGKITLGTGKITGTVAVPSPTGTNYKGPNPSGSVIVVTPSMLPVMPAMPANTPFDNQVAANTSNNNITNPQTPLSPGVYRKLALTGNKTLTFNGPGNYIFYEVNNGTTTNKFVFDFKNTTAGTINIYVIKDARWGLLSVSTRNGNDPSRIFTEIHGTGSTFGGYSFDLQGPASVPAGSNVWLGNVWAPNGGISVINTLPLANGTPHIIGALWSGKKINIKNDLKLVYQSPAAGPNFNYIEPYYAPPPLGKVTAANNVIGAELLSLYQDPTPITSIPDNEIFILDNAGKVMIEVISKAASDNTLRSQLVSLGMTGIVDNGPHIYVISGFFPISNLPQLNGNTLIDYVRPLYPPISNAGQVTTQGDTTMRSHNVRGRFGLDGTGVKVGVISDSYNSKLVAQNDVDQGDLPGIKTNGQPNDNPNPVQVVTDLAQRGNDEGRAMLQIVHDVAPKAKLAFRTGFLTAGDFAKGIQELASPTLPGGPCDVIVDDLTYITEPFLLDGVVAQTVDQVAAQGVTYFTSAGNFGKQSYESVFTGVTNTSVIASGQIHRYGSTAADIYQSVNLKPGSYTIVLQWSDEFSSLGSAAGVQTDMDLYLLGANGFTLFGFNRSNLFGDPFEVCPFTVEQETNAKIMVVRAAGTSNVRFKYIIFRGDATILDYQTGNSSMVGHPNATGAIAVGAMLYANIPPFTPVWPGVASFSSRGGTATLQNNIFSVRNKPELIGPNGTNTTVNLGGAAFNDGDPYPNFFGTSAAAPHAAAVGALLIQARKKFNLQSTVTPAEIRQQLISSAGKFSYLQGNFSFEGGYGYVQADSAVQQIANAKPIADTLIAVTPGDQNGSLPFQVKIKGKYLTPGTQIFVGGTPVPTTVSPDKTEATATIPAIAPGGNPAFQLSNSAKSPSQLDGGLSEELFFFSARIPVTVIAQNASRKYGQENPTFGAQILVNGVPIGNTNVSPESLMLDGNNLTFTTIATPTSSAGLYGIFPSRTTPLATNDPLLTQYSFTFVSGTLTVEKMLLTITPQNQRIKYGEYPGEVTYNYELTQSPSNSATLLEEVKALHKKYLAENGLIVVNGANAQNPINPSDLLNMSTMASFQSVFNARKFVLQNGQLKALVNTIDPSQIGDQRFIVDVSAQSLQGYSQNPAQANLITPTSIPNARGFLNIKSLTNGTAKAAVPNGTLQPMVNGQLLAMVNGQLQAIVNGQLKALVNNIYVDATDLVFQNGQLLALVNGVWSAVSNGQLQAIVNGAPATIDLSIFNGQLQAIVNAQYMQLVNGQLQAIVNGQLVAIVNGQLKALVNGQVMPLVNGQLVAIVNEVLQPLTNGKLVAIVNGQLMVLENNELETVQDLSLSNGQLKALVNGQLKAIVNGQLKALVNGVITDVPTTDFSLVNGQLKAIVNGQEAAYVNGQLLALVNGQLKALVNGSAVEIQSVRQLANGQLKALVNGITDEIPITNGQLQALVNGQLLAMVNGQLMAIVNNELTFVVFQNGQLKALVNGQFQTLANGYQLQAIVNGQLKALVNSQTPVDNSYRIVNGQVEAIVNGEPWVYPNGQLKALVNGQLKALVNNFDVSGTNNNAKTLVLVDEDDINLQGGDVGGMFSMNMITGLDAGIQTLIPGSFVNENFEVTYGLGQVEILPTPLTATANNAVRVYGEANPVFTKSYSGFAFDENESRISAPDATTPATIHSYAGVYPIDLSGGGSNNYFFALYYPGTLTIGKKDLTVSADDKAKVPGAPNPPLTISYGTFAGDDTKDSLCFPIVIPPTPRAIQQLNYLTTYSDVKLNGGANFIYATPGQSITLEGNYNSVYNDPTNYCPGCITQIHIGLSDGDAGNVFNDCYELGSIPAGAINRTFNAPSTPGVYYLTPETTWWYYCGQFADPVRFNGPGSAIAVVIVNASDNIETTTTATTDSPAGTYPIYVGGCYYNPSYRVTLVDGTLTVDPQAGNRSSGANTSTTVAAKSKTTDIAGTTKISVNKLYPNPASSLLRLELVDELRTIKDIQVYDMVGKMNPISSKRINAGTYELNISKLTKGVYFVTAKTTTGIKTFRFIKM